LEFAPLSVKSESDFAEILSQENPDIWRSNRPAESGETAALFKRIVEQALTMRASSPKRKPQAGRKKAVKTKTR
jgi:hypothetical protein